MRTLALILILASPALAGGPQFGPKYDSDKTNMEFQNVYHDVQNIANGRYIASSMTLQGLTVDSITVNSQLLFKGLSGMRVLQLVGGNTSGNTTTASTSFVNTSLSVNVSPLSASSTFFILAMGVGDATSAGGAGLFTIAKGSTNLGGTNGLTIVNAGVAADFVPLSMAITNSPNTTSNVNYVVQYAVSGSGNAGFCATSVSCWIFAFELGS